MTLQEIRVSGLLELYLIGALTEQENTLVEETIEEYPQLRDDLEEIGKTLEGYANLYKVTPNQSIKDNLLQQIKDAEPVIPPRTKKSTKASKQTKTKSKDGFAWDNMMIWPIAASLFFISTAGLIYKSWHDNNKAQAEIVAFQNQIKDCQDEKSGIEEQLIVFDALRSADNQIIPIAPSKKYPQAALFVFNNNKTQKNFLQISNLPIIAPNQSFQLWSLKGDRDPMPLDVFQSGSSTIIEVKHILDSDSYAITIEPKGGSTTPTLTELIGVFDLDS
jgi:anti-sigma-K factor RskA